MINKCALLKGLRSSTVVWSFFVIVINTPWDSRRLLALLMTVGVCMPAAFGAETADGAILAPGLNIVLPSPLGLSLEKIEQHDQYPVIVGEIGKAPAYFISAVKVRRWERSSVLWEKLEMELRRQGDSRSIKTFIGGSFSTDEGVKVSYKGYEYFAHGHRHRPVYFLLKGENSIYWVTLVTVEGVNMQVVLPVVEALVQRVRITR